MPEIMPRPGDNQILLNLKNGSKLMQLELWLRYRRLLEGISQPARDRFAAASMADILRRRRPHLALMHFTCYDSLCHIHGEDFGKLQPALETLDEGLGLLLSALDGGAAGNPGGASAGNSDTAVILFSDHAQLPLEKTILPNDILVEMGLLGRDAEGRYRPGGTGCFIECCGGSAFFHPGALADGGKADGKADGFADSSLTAIRRRIETSPGFNRWLSAGEMAVSGRGNLPFGFCALEGCAYGAYDTGEKAQHGYPADYDNYGVFYAARGAGTSRGKTIWGGSLLDIAPLALRLLGAGLPPEKRPALPGLPEARGDFFEPED
jgi:hypothetical protein